MTAGVQAKGVSRNLVSQWRRRGKMPPPAAELAMGPVWSDKTIRPWLREQKRSSLNAVGEPRRRQILDVLAAGEIPVNDLVARLDLAQPQVSKHLRVLRQVGLVEVRDEGRQRLYRLNARPLKTIHDWVKDYERAWRKRFDALEEVLEELKEEEQGDGSDG